MAVQEFRQHASEVTRGFSPESVKDLVLRCLAEDMGRRHGDRLRIARLGRMASLSLHPLRIDAPNREVHLGQSPRRVVGFLTVDGD